MKKKNLFYGCLYIIAGILFIILCLINKGKVSSLFSGFAGASICIGTIQIVKYFYWNNPKRIQKYKEKLEDKKIILEDERNEMYRDKAGRHTYKISMIIIPVSIILFSILNVLDIYNSLVILIYLFILWIVLYVSGIFYYQKLKRNE